MLVEEGGAEGVVEVDEGRDWDGGKVVLKIRASAPWAMSVVVRGLKSRGRCEWSGGGAWRLVDGCVLGVGDSIVGDWRGGSEGVGAASVVIVGDGGGIWSRQQFGARIWWFGGAMMGDREWRQNAREVKELRSASTSRWASSSLFDGQRTDIEGKSSPDYHSECIYSPTRPIFDRPPLRTRDVKLSVHTAKHLPVFIHYPFFCAANPSSIHEPLARDSAISFTPR